VISDEECVLWKLAIASPPVPGAFDVYLDWLLTHDPKRGELTQQAARGNATAWLNAAWRTALGLPPQSDVTCTVLPVWVTIDAEAVDALDPVLERLPFLRVDVRFESPDGAAEVFARPVFAKIRSLWIWASKDTYDDERYFQARSTTYHGEPVLAALCESLHVRDLEALLLPDHAFGAGCAARIAAGPFRNLRRLWIHGAQIGDAGAIALASSPVAATLQKLELQTCGIGDAGALAIAHSPYLTQLEELDIAHRPLGEEAKAALRARGFRKLEM
jgi:hypothetical protein